MTELFARYVHFFWAGLAKQGQTGAIIPSQRFLIDKMIAPVPLDYDGRVIELGPGTGALTLRLAEHRRQARVLACEINPILARDTRRVLASAGFEDRVTVANESAESLLARVCSQQTDRPDFIISGIPLGNLDKEKVTALIEAIHKALVPGGMYVQFQHSFLDRKKIQTRFARFRTEPVFLNFPPAVVYYAQK